MGQMQIMGEKGDLKIEWDTDNDEEVKAAEKAFDEYLKRGGQAFKMDEDGHQKGSKLRKFDKNAGKILMTPAMQGG